MRQHGRCGGADRVGDGEEDRSVSAILVGEEEECVGFSGAEWEEKGAEE